MVSSLASIYFDSPQLSITNKLYKTLDCWSRDMLNIYFLEKGLEIVSPSHFLYDFSIRIFLMLYSINWQNFIFCWLPLNLEILGNMYIVIVCFQSCDVINFEINPIFLIKPFSYLAKNSRQKCKYVENKKSFKDEIKSIFHRS